jgi:hypothetical protein
VGKGNEAAERQTGPAMAFIVGSRLGKKQKQKKLQR